MLATQKHNASALFWYTQRYHASTKGYLAQSRQTKGPGPWTPIEGPCASDTGPLVLGSWIHLELVLLGQVAPLFNYKMRDNTSLCSHSMASIFSILFKEIPAIWHQLSTQNITI